MADICRWEARRRTLARLFCYTGRLGLKVYPATLAFKDKDIEHEWLAMVILTLISKRENTLAALCAPFPGIYIICIKYTYMRGTGAHIYIHVYIYISIYMYISAFSLACHLSISVHREIKVAIYASERF